MATGVCGSGEEGEVGGSEGGLGAGVTSLTLWPQAWSRVKGYSHRATIGPGATLLLKTHQKS